VSNEQRIWSFAITNESSYGGNTGYQDLASSLYRYDDKVQYHAQVSPGDLAVVVVDGEGAGIARVDRVLVRRDVKTLQRCPGCKTTDIARRRTVSPTYRCNRCKETFEHPKHDVIDVDVHEAHLVDWVPLRGISGDDIRNTALSKGQTSIRPLESSKVRALLTPSPGVERLMD
jgi:ribosomal protein L37AE/L43A